MTRHDLASWRAGLIAAALLLIVSSARAASSAENFDGVVSPALPNGWTTLGGANGVGWQIWNNGSDTPPNHMRSEGDPNNNLLDMSLTSPLLSIASANVTLSFRQKYYFETDDGGRLEIAISGVADSQYRDILEAGGEFVAGEYSGYIYNSSNPINGNWNTRVWTGSAPEYTTVSVKLPTSAAGTTIRLRWRMASDNGGLATSVWDIDSIMLCDAGDTTSTICQNNNCGNGACGVGGSAALLLTFSSLGGAKLFRRRPRATIPATNGGLHP